MIKLPIEELYAEGIEVTIDATNNILIFYKDEMGRRVARHESLSRLNGMYLPEIAINDMIQRIKREFND